ncbi:MAG TPA: MFS transporter [Microbacterium sp.]|nr:MFS transporter [Microbacterium sp.]
MRRDHLIDLRPLTASAPFARMWFGSTLGGLGGQLTIVAVMLHMYELTGSSFAVAMIAVAGLVPMILAGLYGGMLADAVDRRALALGAASITFVSTVLLMALTWTGAESVVWLYVLSVVNSAANSVVMATRQAIVPRLLPRDLLAAASALQGIAMGIMVAVGPALGGVLVATVGYGWTYTIDVALMSALFLGLWTLPPVRPEGEIVKPGLASLVDGWRFLRRAGNIRLQFILDIIAMTFGHPLALFPAIGAVLLGGGPVTTGLLTASIAIGALLSSVFSGQVARFPFHGIGIARAITVYGSAIALFGLVLLMAQLGVGSEGGVDATTPNAAMIAAACAALAITGAADNVSSIYRNTMLQAAVPDAMRGRLQGVFIVVVAGGPRVGALYVGVFSTVAALWVPEVVGGLIIVALTATLVRFAPRFRSYDARHPEP